MTIDLKATRVLVVDDSDFTRDILVAMLRDIGFEMIFQAGDGTDALRQLDATSPGLIICDIDMKPMDGLAFLDELRRHPWIPAAAIPVVFTTVHTETAIVQHATQLGADGYIVKPVKRNELEARVRAALERTARRPD
ncbi:MAG: response regulator [Alphaproteobacteria bacterium]|nr:response regulator [Alphaproteobacteria bacterium]